MKIAHCVPVNLNNPGGVEKHIMRLTEAMRPYAGVVDVYGKSDAGVINGNTGGQVANERGWRSITEFVPGRYDVIHTHSGFYTPRFIRMQLNRGPRQRWVHTLHGIATDYLLRCGAWLNWRSYWCSFTEAMWGHYADRTIAVSRKAKEQARRYYRVAPGKIEVVYNGHEPTVRDEADREATRRKYGLGPEHVVVLFVGRGYDKVKGTELIQETMKRLYARNPRVRLMAMPGDGFATAPWLVRTGPVAHEATAGYYQAGDILVNASLSEGLPLTVVEAMANGLAIAAAPAGGIPEIVRHEYSGLLLRPDRRDIGMQLERLINSAALRDRLGKRALEQSRALTWRRLARETLAVYEEARRGTQDVHSA